jgi:hypothetical protein
MKVFKKVKTPNEDLPILVKALMGQQLVPAQEEVLQLVWDKISSLIITHPGWGKTHMIAVLALLSAWKRPGVRVACMAPSWRQSQIIYEYIEKIIAYSPTLQTCISKLHKDNGKWEIRFHETHHVVGVSDHQQSRISSFALDNTNWCYFKGYRAHVLLVDEMVHLPEEIFNNVLRPIVLTGIDPVLSVQYEHDKEKIESLKCFSKKQKDSLLQELHQTNSHLRPGQLIMFTEAHYKYNYVYKLYNHLLQDPDSFVRTYAWFDSPESFLDPKYLYYSKKTIPEKEFQMLYEGRWGDE